MKKSLILFILLITSTLLFNKKLISIYFSYKFSKWVEKKVIFDEFDIEYPNSISISGLKVINSDDIYYNSIFEAENIFINFNLKSLFFSELIIVNNLLIEKPIFFLELIEKNKKSGELNETIEVIYEDNIGLAKKINEDLPDKIWPKKNKDTNFLILNSDIIDGKAFIKVTSIPESFEIVMSKMKFSQFGNHKDNKHYKSVLKIMLFDIFARVEDSHLKKLLKQVYNF